MLGASTMEELLGSVEFILTCFLLLFLSNLFQLPWPGVEYGGGVLLSLIGHFWFSDLEAGLIFPSALNRSSTKCFLFRYMTSAQIVQFIIVIIHTSQLFFFKDCEYPIFFAWLIIFNAVIYLILFTHFYYRVSCCVKTTSEIRFSVWFFICLPLMWCLYTAFGSFLILTHIRSIICNFLYQSWLIGLTWRLVYDQKVTRLSNSLPRYPGRDVVT